MSDQTDKEPVLITEGEETPTDQPVSEDVDVPQEADQRQVLPAETVTRDPDDWKEPGDWEKGFFPGDPNTYPDPDNPTRSP